MTTKTIIKHLKELTLDITPLMLIEHVRDTTKDALTKEQLTDVIARLKPYFDLNGNLFRLMDKVEKKHSSKDTNK